MAVDEEAVAPAEAPDVRWGMGDALAGNAVILVASTLAFSVASGVFGEDVLERRELWLVALLQIPLWLGLLGAPLVATYRKGRRSLRSDFGLEMRWTDVPLGIGVGIAGQFLLGYVIWVLYDVLGLDTDRVGESAEGLADAARDPLGVAVLVLVVVVAAPVFEELFYRGLWLRSVERRLGGPAAVLVTSFVFALIHFQWYDFPALLGIGVIFGLLAIRTGRLGAAIWAHVAFNATTVVSLLVLG